MSLTAVPAQNVDQHKTNAGSPPVWTLVIEAKIEANHQGRLRVFCCDPASERKILY